MLELIMKNRYAIFNLSFFFLLDISILDLVTSLCSLTFITRILFASGS